ncbi:hypothetical protein EBR56_10030, partial [bacterium]|nr:hypothetical protein [bacterium]
MPYEAFLEERILEPLGMTDTTFRPTAAQLARIAMSHRRGDSGGLVPVPIDLPPLNVATFRERISGGTNQGR